MGDSSNAIADLERAVFLSGSLQQRNRAQVILNMINLEAGRFQQVLNDISAFKKLHRRKETAAEIYFQECLAALALNKKHRETGGFKELEKLYPNHPLLSML